MAILLYNFFLWLYKCAAIAISPFNNKAKLWLQGRKNIFNHLQQLIKGAKNDVIWFHCASLGEFEQGRPVLEAIKSHYPQYKILLTFFSPSGYEIRKDYPQADYITYLPLDSAANAKKMLQIVQPKLVIWVKYEFWYYYLQQIKTNNIPLLLVSGIFRESQPFFKWYGAFHKKMLINFSYFFVQNNHSKILLESIGFAENVTVSGDTRFDRVIQIAAQSVSIPAIDSFIHTAPTIVAGSTWQEDEEELNHFANTHPNIKFIIAPHHINEERLQSIEKLFHSTIRYSVLIQNNKQYPSLDFLDNLPHVLIIDNIGMLSSLYAYATITYVGGGFGADGVHNVLEAAVYEKPVIFGPVYEKYIEAVGLMKHNGAYTMNNALQIEKKINELLNNQKIYNQVATNARNFVYTNTGATEKIMLYIQEKRLLTN